jgi:hypothetical protein
MLSNLYTFQVNMAKALLLNFAYLREESFHIHPHVSIAIATPHGQSLYTWPGHYHSFLTASLATISQYRSFSTMQPG